MKILEKYLSLDRNFVLDQLDQSLSIDEFWKRLNIGSGLRSNRDRPIFEQKFGISIIRQLEENQSRQKELEHQKLFSLDRICRHPKCQNHFTWNDRPYSDFCSSKCAHSYSSSFVDHENIKTGMKESTKIRTIKCLRCGKDVEVKGSVSNILCKECKYLSNKNPSGKCMICGKPTKSGRKTCCKEHAKQLRAKTFSKTQEKYHRCGGKRPGSGRGKKGWYKGYFCDSSWELAWVLYAFDNNISFKRNSQWFQYTFEGKTYKYYPDFILSDGTFIEIKGWNSEKWKAKLEAFPIDQNLKVYYFEDLVEILNYVKQKYGNNFTDLYE